MRHARVAVAVALAAIVVAAASCKSATYVTINVTTDAKCADIRGVAIAVGRPGDELESSVATSSSTFCDANGNVGTITISPSGPSDDEIGVRVVAGFGKSVEECPPYDSGCIVARRVVRYAGHEALQVGVKLYADCAGVPCGALTTCVQGKGCVDAHIADTSKCLNTAGCGDDVLGAEADASVEGGAGPDGGPSTPTARYIDFYAALPPANACNGFTPTAPSFQYMGRTYETIGWDAWSDAKGYGWAGDAVGDPTRALAGYDQVATANVLQESYLYDNNGSRQKFEITVANGDYNITVGLGRPCKDYPSDPMNLWLEAVKVIDEFLPNTVSERTFPVVVADGRLTLEMGREPDGRPGAFTFVSYLNIVPR